MRDNDCRGCGKGLDLTRQVFRAQGGGYNCPDCEARECPTLAEAAEQELQRLELLSYAMDLAVGERPVRH
jgi:hypothetical protein